MCGQSDLYILDSKDLMTRVWNRLHSVKLNCHFSTTISLVFVTIFNSNYLYQLWIFRYMLTVRSSRLELFTLLVVVYFLSVLNYLKPYITNLKQLWTINLLQSISSNFNRVFRLRCLQIIMYITTHYPDLNVDGDNVLTIHLKYVKTRWKLF